MHVEFVSCETKILLVQCVVIDAKKVLAFKFIPRNVRSVRHLKWIIFGHALQAERVRSFVVIVTPPSKFSQTRFMELNVALSSLALTSNKLCVEDFFFGRSVTEIDSGTVTVSLARACHIDVE